MSVSSPVAGCIGGPTILLNSLNESKGTLGPLFVTLPTWSYDFPSISW